MHAGRSFRTLASLSLILTGGLLTGCPTEEGGTPLITVTASAGSILADGEAQVGITVSGTDSDGNPLAGTLLLNTNKGSFDNGSKAVTGPLVNGSFQATLTACDSQADPACAGPARVSATVGSAMGSTIVTFQGLEANCGDGQDDDGDGLTDCADPDCDGLSAGNGAVCESDARVCYLLDAEGAPTTTVGEDTETTCNDFYDPEDPASIRDNDCDGQANCDDTDCTDQLCNAVGWRCMQSACTCPFEATREGLEVGDCFVSDNKDNDCDGLADGDDPDCMAMPCNADGNRWGHEDPDDDTTPIVCDCHKDQDVETSCTDGFDNDCDGTADCADLSCQNKACSLDEPLLRCAFDDAGAALGCVCPGDPTGSGFEDACDDGLDNDCDGLTDCEDENCGGAVCGTYGQECQGSVCTCMAGSSPETACSDVDADGNPQDNDCDGLANCADSDCGGRLCGDNGLTCNGPACECPGGTNESTASVGSNVYACGDNQDNDCDGTADCADDDCQYAACARDKICDDPDNDGTFACVLDPGNNGLLLAGDRPKVIADGTSQVLLTATVTNNQGVAAGVPVEFGISGGEIVEANGAMAHTVTTDSDGLARIHWRPGMTPSPALTATARIDHDGDPLTAMIEKTVSVQVIGLQDITFVSTEYETMGLKESGWRETSELSFLLKGTDGQNVNLPMPDGVEVSFVLNTIVGGLTLTSDTATTVASRVSTTAIAGTQVVQFSVRATATVGMVTDYVDSNTINIIGAKPSHGGFTLSCANKNVNALGVFLTDSFPDQTNVQRTIDCTATLNDRAGNPILRPDILVKFFSEGGTMQSDVAIDNGASTATFNTVGNLPKDVAPLPTEPSWLHEFDFQPDPNLPIQQFSITRNPRDGFNTVIAFIAGEEAFTDSNGDGAYNAGEPYIDLSEPYIDANDSGSFDVGERFWDVNGNSQFDGPNGTWDSNTLIWTQTRLVYSGCQYTAHGFTDYLQSFPLIANGASASVRFRSADINMNQPEGGTSYRVAKVSGDVNVTIEAGGTTFVWPDGWGMSWGLQNDCTTQPCTLRSIILPPTEETYGGRVWVHVADSRDTDTDDPKAFSITTTIGPCNPNLAFGAAGMSD